MISVKRLNGTDLWLNPLLIESVESTPDSIITLSNGHKYVVHDSPEEIVDKTSAFMRTIGIVASVNRRDDHL